MSAVPITEQTITEALRRLPPERWPQVLAFIDSLQPTPAPPSPAAAVKRWTAAELRKLPPAQRDAILAEQAAALEDEYRNDPELTAFEAFGDEDLYVDSSDAERGDVWLINFDPTVGAEIRKVRPAVVLTVAGVGRLPLQIVVPLTDWKAHYANAAWFVHLPSSPANGLSKDSGADAFQVKSLSERRFVKRLGEVTGQQLDDIAAAVALCVGAP